MKRLLDLVLSIGLLVLFAPVFIFIAILVRTNLGAPIFFKQVRPGLHGRPFVLVKFRTMRDAVDTSGEEQDDDMRLTRFGRLLRATSLDELPELFNVIKGDMSLVGPRPLLMSYLDKYSNTQARRHEVRPGITGWAQVKGRNALSWSERLALDVWYVDNRSFFLDLKILILTVVTVLTAKGVSHEGHATMPKFEGGGSKDEK